MSNFQFASNNSDAQNPEHYLVALAGPFDKGVAVAALGNNARSIAMAVLASSSSLNIVAVSGQVWAELMRKLYPELAVNQTQPCLQPCQDAAPNTPADAKSDPSSNVMPEPQPAKKLKEEDVVWVVNSLGELGVRIGGQCFFQYKGRSLEYDPDTHDDGTPLMYREIFSREFGETTQPTCRVGRCRLSERYTEDGGAGNPWRPL